MPTKINGFTIVAAAFVAGGPATRDGHYILVDRGEGMGRWVSTWLGLGDTSWGQGHYFNERSEANAHFAARVVKIA